MDDAKDIYETKRTGYNRLTFKKTVITVSDTAILQQRNRSLSVILITSKMNAAGSQKTHKIALKFTNIVQFQY